MSQSAVDQTPKPRKSRFAWRLLAVAAVVAAAGVYVSKQSPQTQINHDILVLFGNVDIRDVQLSFNESDRIKSVLVKEGDRVSPGMLLAELDTRRLKAAAARAEAQVASQKQILLRLVNGTRPEDIRKARADVDLAKAELDYARTTSARRDKLAASRAASEQDADDARAAFATGEAKLAAAQALLDLAIAGPRREDIDEARASLEALEAQLAFTRIELADASLYSSSTGVIQERLLEPGDMASPQRPVLTIALTDPVWVRAYVPEPDLGKISLGMKAEIETDSYPGKRYKGWIGFISPTAEFTPKSVEVPQLRTRLVYQVRVYVNNSADELRLGMPATVRIPLTQPRPAAAGPGDDHPSPEPPEAKRTTEEHPKPKQPGADNRAASLPSVEGPEREQSSRP